MSPYLIKDHMSTLDSSSEVQALGHCGDILVSARIDVVVGDNRSRLSIEKEKRTTAGTSSCARGLNLTEGFENPSTHGLTEMQFLRGAVSRPESGSHALI